MSVSEIVDRYERTWAERDSHGMATCFASGGTYNAPGAANVSGHHIGEFAEGFCGALPDPRYEWATAVCGEQVAAVRWEFSGTMTGSLMGIPPTGGKASARGAHIIRLSGDKLATVEAYWDNQSFFEQLG